MPFAARSWPYVRRQLAQAQGRQLTIRESSEQGSVFVLSLPSIELRGLLQALDPVRFPVSGRTDFHQLREHAAEVEAIIEAAS